MDRWGWLRAWAPYVAGGLAVGAALYLLTRGGGAEDAPAEEAPLADGAPAGAGADAAPAPTAEPAAEPAVTAEPAAAAAAGPLRAAAAAAAALSPAQVATLLLLCLLLVAAYLAHLALLALPALELRLPTTAVVAPLGVAALGFAAALAQNRAHERNAAAAVAAVCSVDDGGAGAAAPGRVSAPAPAGGEAVAADAADGDAASDPAMAALLARLAAYAAAADALDAAGAHGDAAAALLPALAAAAAVHPEAAAGCACDAAAAAAGAPELLARLPPLAAAAAAAGAAPAPWLRSRRRARAELEWRAARNEFLAAAARLRAGGGAEQPAFAAALRHAHASLALHEACADAHKWAGVLESKAAADTRARIAAAFRIRDHAERALEIRPSDVVVLHMLGVWHYEVAALPWVQRQVATALFGAPPQSDFATALALLERSEAAAAAAGGAAHMMPTRLKAAQACVKLGRADDARRWLRAARALPPGPADEPADVAALGALCKQLGVDGASDGVD